MSSSATVRSILLRSGLTKSALSSASGISRSLLDGYLKGDQQPSLPQLERLAEAAGLRLDVRITTKPQPVSSEYVAVMELAGQLAGKRGANAPLKYPYRVWRSDGA